MWLLAWRNLWRNRTRTLITGTAISLSFALQLISYGTADATYEQMMDSAVRTAGGSVLVHGGGYWKSRGSEIVLADPAPVLETIRGTPGVEAALPRVLSQVLVSSPRGNAGAQLQGIAPDEEATLQDLSRYVTEGSFLGGEADDPIVLGRGIVDDLGLEMGDRVVVTATDPNGDMVRALFHLTGVLETGSEMLDEAAAYTTLPAARGALGMEGRLTQVGVVLRDDSQRAEVRDRIAARLGERTEGLELLTWDEAMPELVGFIEIDSSMNEVFAFVVFLIVVFGIANTILMSVMERIRELGLLSAIGLTPARLFRLVVYETTLLAGICVTIGLGLGYLGHLWFAHVGLDLSVISSADIEVSGVVLEDMVIRSVVDPIRWATATLVVFALVVVSAMYPAWRATRVQPAEAMRTYA
ncbi:MAG: ABC transporter permease [Myxococcota bacterium]